MTDPSKMPEEWLKFLTVEKTSYSGPNKYRYLMNLYRRATESIPVNQFGHNNTAYAKILVDYAKLRALTSEDEARNIFQAAKNSVKHCSLVYVAWAQFELIHSNAAKCQKLLSKGKQMNAKPDCLLDMALENFNNGSTQLIDEETEEHTFTELINNTSKTEEDMISFIKQESTRSDSSLDSNSPTDLSSPETLPNTAGSLEEKKRSSTEAKPDRQNSSHLSSRELPQLSTCKERNFTAEAVELVTKRPKDVSSSENVLAKNESDKKSSCITAIDQETSKGEKQDGPGADKPQVISERENKEVQESHSKSHKWRPCMATTGPGISQQLNMSSLSLVNSSCSSASSGSSDVMNSTSFLSGVNSVGNPCGEREKTALTPQEPKMTPQPAASTNKYTFDSSMVKERSRRAGLKRLAFVGLPQRVRRPIVQEPEDLEEDKNEGPKKAETIEEEKRCRKEGIVSGESNSRNKEDSVDGVFAFPNRENHGGHDEHRKHKSIYERRQQHACKSLEKLNITGKENGRSEKKLEADNWSNPIQEQKFEGASVVARRQPNEFYKEKQRPVAETLLSRKEHETTAETALSDRGQQSFKNGGSVYPMCHSSPPGDRPAPHIQLHKAPANIEPLAPEGVQPAYPIPAPFANSTKGILLVNGKVYNKLNVIGKGGSSKVYKVFDGQKEYAIKYVNVEDAEPEVIQSYVNEITLLKRLQGHDSIIKLYDWEMDEAERVIKIVLEIGSTDLAGYLRKNPGKITVDFIKVCWKQILDAVQVIHEEGIVHTDLKPANFLLVEWNLKLIDFGIANAIQADSTSFFRDSQIGTLNYMSPEALMDISQQQGCNEHHKPMMKIGRASDVWSLGCILYLMVYGKLPFQHITNRVQKWKCIMDPNYEIKFPHIENQDLLDSMKGCLRRNPRERYTIPQLQNHPFLTGRTSESNVESVLNCIMQMKDINSPTTLRALTQNMLKQLSSGGSLDMASIQPSQKRPGMRACQPSRQPLLHNNSVGVAQDKKNQYQAKNVAVDDKENVVLKIQR